jgi:hypothetical protein
MVKIGAATQRMLFLLLVVKGVAWLRMRPNSARIVSRSTMVVSYGAPW